ncbi:MAG: glycosyltransferase family 4 protein [Deltaproteobacteria bacterium]|jgi:glycosyltransferase involved in cell wall biosynthesis|nr:glycosyltransferase family 4 protein [Deltaproteobacteria bacterium]
MNAYAKTKKVLLITNIPTPYRIPLFNELNAQMESNGLKLKVVFGALTYPRRKWIIDMSECRFDYIVLPARNIHKGNSDGTLFTYSRLLTILYREKADLIIVAGFSIATIKLWFLSLFKRTPYIIWSGAVERKGQKTPSTRRMQRKILIKRAASFIAYGTRAKDYLVSLGANESDVYIGINTVDVEHFKVKTIDIRNNLGNDERKKHLLHVGHLTKGKRIDQLFYAIKLLLDKRQDLELHIVGSGPEQNNLMLLAQQMKIDEFVRFEGYKQKEHIPYYLAQADLFLFPSEYDVWGLVLVEAMAAGVPCIASVYAGATQDLIEDGVTGFVMDFCKTAKVAKKINWLLENPHLAKQIGQNASRFVGQNISLEKAASGFVETIRNTMQV